MAQTAMPAMFADFDVTLTDPKERPLRDISTKPGDNGIPKETVEFMRYLYETAQSATVSFRDGKEYFGKNGESAAKAFVNDAKDSFRHITPKPEHKNGVSVTANADGIVVKVSVGAKRGRTANATDASSK